MWYLLDRLFSLENEAFLVSQANYAAANAVLGAWAGGANGAGVAATAVMWGAWAGGMAAADKGTLVRNTPFQWGVRISVVK